MTRFDQGKTGGGGGGGVGGGGGGGLGGGGGGGVWGGVGGGGGWIKAGDREFGQPSEQSANKSTVAGRDDGKFKRRNNTMGRGVTRRRTTDGKK